MRRDYRMMLHCKLALFDREIRIPYKKTLFPMVMARTLNFGENLKATKFIQNVNPGLSETRFV